MASIAGWLAASYRESAHGTCNLYKHYLAADAVV